MPAVHKMLRIYPEFIPWWAASGSTSTSTRPPLRLLHLQAATFAFSAFHGKKNVWIYVRLVLGLVLVLGEGEGEETCVTVSQFLLRVPVSNVLEVEVALTPVTSTGRERWGADCVWQPAGEPPLLFRFKIHTWNLHHKIHPDGVMTQMQGNKTCNILN